MAVTCSQCSQAISPTMMDLVPSYLWSVEIDCPNCEHSNRLPWLTSFAIVGLAIAIVFTISVPLLSKAGVPTGFIALFTVTAWLLLVRGLLLLYLRFSNRPFVSNRRGA